MAQWEIVSIRERRDLDAMGNLVTVIEISWTYDDQGPFTVEIPKEQFSAETVRTEIEKQVAEFRKLLGT